MYELLRNSYCNCRTHAIPGALQIVLGNWLTNPRSVNIVSKFLRLPVKLSLRHSPNSVSDAPTLAFTMVHLNHSPLTNLFIYYINHLAVISHDSEVVNNIGGQQRPRTSIIIRLSVTLVAWRGSSFGRDSQPMLISVLTRSSN